MKNIKRLAVILSAALMIFAFAACGEKKTETPDVTNSGVSSEVESKEESSAADDSDKLLTDYVKQAQEEVGALDGVFGDSVAIEIIERDKKFVYQMKINEDTGVANDEMKATFDELMADQSSVYTALVDDMTEKGIKNPVVLVEILDFEGEVISSYEYK